MGVAGARGKLCCVAWLGFAWAAALASWSACCAVCAGPRQRPAALSTLTPGNMLSRDRVSLNAMAFDSTCKLIEGVLAQGVNLAEAYIDALGDTTKHKVG